MPDHPEMPGTARGPIGLVGLGLMGLAMAERLQAGGQVVIGWDISSNALSKFSIAGGVAANSSHEVFTRCDTVILSLPNDAVVSTVVAEAASALRQGQIIVDTSTGAPEASVRIGEGLGKRGVEYLDATISGNSDQLRRGEVLVMAGGSREAFEKCEALLRLFARLAFHVGAIGAGAKMKLVTNLVLGLNRAALAEGLLFARALGLQDEQTLLLLRESMAYSRIMDAKGEKMVRGDFEPQARFSQHLKDVRLMLEAAASEKTRLPFTETHRDILAFGEEKGLGQLDNSAIILAIELLRESAPER